MMVLMLCILRKWGVFSVFTAVIMLLIASQLWVIFYIVHRNVVTSES